MKKAIWIAVALAAAAGAYFLLGHRKTAEPKYRTAVVDKGNVTQTVAATGTLSAVITVKVGSVVSGIVAALDSGSPLVVTDTNRRRLTRIRGAVPTQSHTLSEGQDLDQPTQDLFGIEGSQSVAEFRDATAIEASS